jgi:plastocyanin
MNRWRAPLAILGPIAPALLSRGGRIASIALLFAAASAFAASVHQVAQRGRAFSASEIAIARGDTLRFTNDDEFLHQIYVDSSQMNFDSDEQAPGQAIDVKFPVRGTFPVRCHIHPKMLLIVHVQ